MLLRQCLEFMSRQQFEHLSQHSVRMSHGLISPVCSVVYGQFNCTKQVEIRPSYSAVYGTAVTFDLMRSFVLRKMAVMGVVIVMLVFMCFLNGVKQTKETLIRVELCSFLVYGAI